MEKKYSFDLRAKYLWPQPGQTKEGLQQQLYLTENEKVLQEFVLKPSIPKLQEPIPFPVIYYDACSLLEQICNSAVGLVYRAGYWNQEDYLNLHDNKIYFLNIEVNLGDLYAIYLEKILHLSTGLKLVYDKVDEAEEVKKVLFFFARYDVQKSVQMSIFEFLKQHKGNKRSKTEIAKNVEKQIQKIIIKQIVFAMINKEIQVTCAYYWLQYVECFDAWLNVLGAYHGYLKTNPSAGLATRYVPWLVVIKRRMIAIRNQQPWILEDKYKQTFRKFVGEIMQWFGHVNRRNFFVWLWPFIFNENQDDTKRKFLYIYGPPNTGKTFFASNLFDSNEFLIKQRNFSYYGSEKPGEHLGHLLIFDDPGEAKGKNHQLGTSELLQFSDTKRAWTLPAKYGVYALSLFQLMIISNKLPEALFDPKFLDAIQSRLLLVNFSDDTYPIKIPSNSNSGFEYRQVNYSADGRFDLVDLGGVIKDLHKDNSNVLPPLNRDMMFYLNWYVILGILKANCVGQIHENLEINIPNKTLRNYALDPDFNTFFEVMNNFTDEELITMVTQP